MDAQTEHKVRSKSEIASVKANLHNCQKRSSWRWRSLFGIVGLLLAYLGYKIIDQLINGK